MPVAGNSHCRKRRYIPSPDQAKAITPHGLVVLLHVATLGLLTALQVALLTARSPAAARRFLRSLLDAGLIRVIVVPRVFMLEELDDPLSATFGSAPSVFQVTAQGLRLLHSLELAAPRTLPPTYGPGNVLFIRHELGVRDAVIFFQRAAAVRGHQVEQLHLGGDATVDLQRTQLPKTARPDAWLLYRFGQRVLAACIEYDTGSERGTRRWDDKLTAYRYLLDPVLFHATTGHEYGRVVVVCRTEKRRDQLTALIAERAPVALGERFWLAAKEDLETPDLSLPVWRRPGEGGLIPLIPPDIYRLEDTPAGG